MRRVTDDYGTLAERRRARAPDEEHDWRRVIHHPDLATRFSVGGAGFPFLGAEGFRFILPAVMSRVILEPDGDRVADLQEALLINLVDPLDSRLGAPHLESLAALLTRAQRLCVRDVLVYLRGRDELTSFDGALACWAGPR